MRARLFGETFWPETRIRRRGLAGYRNLQRRGFFRSAALFLALFFAVALAYVRTRVHVVETGYRLRSLEVEREKLKEENRSLRVEVATLRSPRRLEEMARTWGLRRPTERQIQFIQ